MVIFLPRPPSPAHPPGEEVQIKALRQKLKVSRQRQGELLSQRDMWKERCVLHERACGGLQVRGGEGGEGGRGAGAAGGTGILYAELWS